MFTSNIKREIRHFHAVVVENGKEMYKKVCCTCKVVVLLNKSIVLFAVLVAAPLSLLKLPNIAWETVSKAFLRSKLTAEVVMPNQC